MSTYTKERNIIIIKLNNSTGDYRFDLNTGVFYGVKGKPVKTCPRHNDIRHMFDYEANGSYLAYALADMFYSGNTADYTHEVYRTQVSAAEKLDALNIPKLRVSLDYLPYLADNIKFLRDWLKENDSNAFKFSDFRTLCDFEKARKELGALAEIITPEMYYTIKNHKPLITKEEWDICVYYLIRGKMWEYHNHDVHKLVEYFGLCSGMGKEPQKVNNFMREYIETKNEYELRKTEFDNKRIADNYAERAKAWEFEYGNYKILIPTKGQDLIDEGARMHHCVGGYVRSIINNECYICFVRHKDKPDVPYITCQVMLDGEIGQYYLAYDNRISKEEDKAFRNAFQDHLKTVWNS
jgi:hypothetical protein